MANNTLLFFCVTLILWMVVVVFMVKEKDPNACKPYTDVAFSRRGLMVLLGGAVLSYFMFLNHSDDVASGAIPTANTYSVSPLIPGPSAMLAQ